jgi:hypothetical protein
MGEWRYSSKHTRPYTGKKIGYRLSQWFIIDVRSVLRLYNRMVVGDIATFRRHMLPPSSGSTLNLEIVYCHALGDRRRGIGLSTGFIGSQDSYTLPSLL